MSFVSGGFTSVNTFQLPQDLSLVCTWMLLLYIQKENLGGLIILTMVLFFKTIMFG